MNGRRYLFPITLALLSSVIENAAAQSEPKEETARPTERGLEVVGFLETAINSALGDVRYPLPDFSVQQNIPLLGPVSIPVTLLASNIECYDAAIDNLDVSIVPTGMLEVDFNLTSALGLKCGMDYEINGGRLLSDQGSITIIIEDSIFGVTASFKPESLTFPTCSFNLGSTQLDFSGSASSDILDYFQSPIAGALEGVMGNINICAGFTSFLGASQDELAPLFSEIMQTNDGGRALFEKTSVIEENAITNNLRKRTIP